MNEASGHLGVLWGLQGNCLIGRGWGECLLKVSGQGNVGDLQVLRVGSTQDGRKRRLPGGQRGGGRSHCGEGLVCGG